MDNKRKPPWLGPLIKEYYKEIIGKPRLSMNKEYSYILETNIKKKQ